MPYVSNAWYVVGWEEDLAPATPLAITVLQQPLVLYRAASGRLVALEDRCVHRLAPLSLGRCEGDRLRCMYHGLLFGPDGKVVEIPGQELVPSHARVRSYPVRDEAPFVWVWLGAPARAAQVSPPALPWLTDDSWTALGGARSTAANYMLLHDNALDRTHFPYVHPERIHRGYVESPPPLQIEVTETTVSYRRQFPPAPLTDWQQAATGLAGDADYTQRESGVFVSPALHVDKMDVLDGAGATFSSVFVRAFTPVDPATTLVFWRAARNYALDDLAVSEALREVHEGTMTEDEPLLEAIQGRSDGRPGYGVSAAADAAAIKAYQIVDAMLDEERGRLGRVSGVRRRG